MFYNKCLFWKKLIIWKFNYYFSFKFELIIFEEVIEFQCFNYSSIYFEIKRHLFPLPQIEILKYN